MIQVLASAEHYCAHLAPIIDRLPLDGLDDVTLVASHRDLVTARRRGADRIVLAQHGAGQSYGGDRISARHPSYPGGDDNHDVGLFLVPNEHAGARWRERYPDARVRVVGCPRLDTLPPRQIDPLDDHPVVAITFHWETPMGYKVPEARSAFPHFRRALAPLAERYKLLGHAHPKATNLARTYRALGIEYVPDFDEVSRRADLLVADNSSVLFEFASTDRPVVVMNAPWYRREVRHGIRYWEGSHVGQNVAEPDDLVDAVSDALRLGWHYPREAVVNEVYTYRKDAAKRAASAILEWAA